jgi:hypothetical protein
MRSRGIFLYRVQFIVRGKLDLSFTHRIAYCLVHWIDEGPKWRPETKYYETTKRFLQNKMDEVFNAPLSNSSQFHIFIRTSNILSKFVRFFLQSLQRSVRMLL